MNNAKEIVRKLYRNDKGEPFELTDGQAEIFDAIFKRKYNRNHCETHTRYGKSETVSMAVLTRAATFPEKWAVVAGNEIKAQIIMNAVIKHIFDNEYTKGRFILDKGESEEKIRRFRNKKRINFKIGKKLLGEIFIATASEAMGLGAPNVIEDESALVKDKDHALVMRMLGDQTDNFLFKIGNPWESEHFTKSKEDPSYHKIRIDYKQGLIEGRITQEFVDEMRQQPFFGVLYECITPKSDTTDERGWIPLLIRKDIENAFIEQASGFGINKLGVDVAGGGRNFSVICQRFTNYARKIHKSNDPDTMNLAERVINIKIAEKVRNQDVFTDNLGIGKGLYDVLSREKHTLGIHGVNAAKTPTNDVNKEKFINLRAEMYWKAREWIMKGGKLLKDDDWYQLTKVKYRVKLEGSKGKMQIMSKEDMLKEGVLSPDLADAFAMTFVTDDIVPMDPEILEMRERQEEGEYDPMHPFGDI